MRSLKQVLDSIYDTYHHPQYLRLDPLLCVHEFSNKRDLEIIGLIAAVLAYGRAEIIIRSVEWIVEKIERQPFDFTLNTSFVQKLKILKGFKHRFNDSTDIAILLEAVAIGIREYGSIENIFVSDSSRNCDTIKENLIQFTDVLRKNAGSVKKEIPRSFNYLLPSPVSGSACKRLNMYLRWMVRKADTIDLGVWKKISADKLIIPVDTHVARIGHSLGFTKRTTADWKMAEEITRGLRKYDPIDPVRFDFSLCRSGMISIRKEAA